MDEIFKKRKKKPTAADLEYADNVKKAVASYGKRKMKKEELVSMIRDELSEYTLETDDERELRRLTNLAKAESARHLQKAMQALMPIPEGTSKAMKAIDLAINRVRQIR